MSKQEVEGTSDEVLAAIKVLCKHIHAYRKDGDKVSICWSNGINLRVNGMMYAGGMHSVAEWIWKNSTSESKR